MIPPRSGRTATAVTTSFATSRGEAAGRGELARGPSSRGPRSPTALPSASPVGRTARGRASDSSGATVATRATPCVGRRVGRGTRARAAPSPHGTTATGTRGAAPRGGRTPSTSSTRARTPPRGTTSPTIGRGGATGRQPRASSLTWLTSSTPSGSAGSRARGSPIGRRGSRSASGTLATILQRARLAARGPTPP